MGERGSPLAILSTCGPCSCPSGCKLTGYFLGSGPWPLEPRAKVSTQEELSFLTSPLTCTIWGWGGGKPLKEYNLLERNVLSNTNVNMIHAISAARLLYVPNSETRAGGSYLSSIPEGDPELGLVLLQHLK